MPPAAEPISPPRTRFSRLLRHVVNVRPGEAAAVGAAFALFFFVLGSYFAVRPVRETIATLLGRERVAGLWLYTAAFSILVIPVYGWLVARVRRGTLLPWIYGSVALVLAGIAAVLRRDEGNLAAGAFFYVWISVLNLLLVSVFWSFLLEVFSRAQSRRLFGFIAAGGTAGALAGPLVARLAVGHIGNAGVLGLGALGFVGAMLCQRWLLRLWSRAGTARPTGEPDGFQEAGRGLGGNPLAGIWEVLRSRYLLGILLFVVFLSLANTILYFEQLRIVEAAFRDPARRTEVFAGIDLVVQALTVLSQVFLTGRIAARLGVRTLLALVPASMVAGFLCLAAFGAFGVIAAAIIVRRWGEYAFVRPGREMLFAGLGTEVKYKAKSFLDVPVYRAADWAGAQTKLAIESAGATPSTVALLGAAVATAWAVNGWLLGRRCDEDGAGGSAVTDAARPLQ